MSADCLKLTTFFGERDRSEHGLLADALLDLYGAHGIQTSVLLRGAEGFGRLHHLHTDRLLTLSEDLPVVSIAVDRRERIEALRAPLAALGRCGLITLERARLFVGGPQDDELASQRPPDARGEATQLTVYIGRRERVGRTPAFAAIVELLHRRGVAGATVLLGVDGTRAGRRVRAQFFARNADVPTVILAVGAGERIASALPELAGLVREPLFTLERVRVCKRDGQLLATPHALPASGAGDLPLWQKLTIYTSQASTHEGHPLHLQIIRRLRATGAAGATSVRGIWGFHGDHAPHGDRLLQTRRHVPVVTVAIDTPARIARAFEVIDELTHEHGLVTSEIVPGVEGATTLV